MRAAQDLSIANYACLSFYQLCPFFVLLQAVRHCRNTAEFKLVEDILNRIIVNDGYVNMMFFTDYRFQ
jgi:hypothetical protein